MIKYIVLTLTLSLILLSGCSYVPEQQESFPTILTEEENCQELFSENAHYSGNTQYIQFDVLNSYAITYEDAMNHGLCYKIRYIPAKLTDYIIHYNYADDEGKIIGETFIGYGDETSIEVFRTSKDDIISVEIEGDTYNYSLGCNYFQYINIGVNKSKEKRYNCVFDGETRASNLSYSDLKNYTCDEYTRYCYG